MLQNQLDTARPQPVLRTAERAATLRPSNLSSKANLGRDGRAPCCLEMPRWRLQFVARDPLRPAQGLHLINFRADWAESRID